MTQVSRLPVIVGFGGYNSAGRSSGHQAYRRMVLESLDEATQERTILGLAALMNLIRWDGATWRRGDEALSPSACAATCREAVLNGTLVRRIESRFFDPDAVPAGKSVNLQPLGEPIRFSCLNRELPDPLPPGWQVEPLTDKESRVTLSETQSVLVAAPSRLAVQSAGQLPSGFEPGDHYRSLHHPRGLQMTILAASDAVHSIGIPWQTLIDAVKPNEIAVYSSSVMSQLDATGFGGLLQARLQGGRATSKQLALGLNTMPADFVNAYVLGSVGATGGVSGACATFLYNLRLGVDEIKSGRRRIVLVGSAEAPIIPEVIEGYSAMGALGTDANLCKLDGTETADHRRASRPFGDNCGFTLAESSQYAVLMDDALALELGANMLGAVPAVYVHADGFKKSISAPGPGNYITLAKAVALAQNLLGEQAVREQSFVQAHGSSTPQNRVTESRIFHKVAEHFGIEHWPVAAVKAYVGHSLGPASGDQLGASLGVFAHGLLPGIKTITQVAEDVAQGRLGFSTRDQLLTDPQVAFLNSKGFGGNNASAVVLAPNATRRLLAKRFSAAQWQAYEARLPATLAAAEAYFEAADRGDLQAIYHFGEQLLHDEDVEFAAGQLNIAGYARPISLDVDEGFEDLRPCPSPAP